MPTQELRQRRAPNMRTGTLTALFLASLALVLGEATNIERDASNNTVNDVDNAYPDLTSDLNARDAAPQKGHHKHVEDSAKGRNDFPGAPPCGDRWDTPPGKEPTDQDIADARASVSKGDKYPKGQKHWICDKQYVICIRIPSHVQQSGKGFWEIARWSNNGDGTTLLAVKYWQESITWSIPGSSAKCYLAHGSEWCCAKGKMSWYYEDENYWLPGNSKKREDRRHTRQVGGPDWGGPCHRGFNSNSDLVLSIS